MVHIIYRIDKKYIEYRSQKEKYYSIYIELIKIYIIYKLDKKIMFFISILVR